jgi:hypothetical protein
LDSIGIAAQSTDSWSRPRAHARHHHARKSNGHRPAKTPCKARDANQGDQIPIICEHESDVAATIDAMIAAGDLSEADRVLCVYWLDCTGPNAPSDDDLRALLRQWEAEEALFSSDAVAQAPPRLLAPARRGRRIARGEDTPD